MVDPQIAEDGHSYEHVAIKAWLEKNGCRRLPEWSSSTPFSCRTARCSLRFRNRGPTTSLVHITKLASRYSFDGITFDVISDDCNLMVVSNCY
ncbi:hypothetical protein MLD38_006549 [Melastoma candidum]|uniref:Uncharacterized protein n=1 Tax=Melastoma candidum TaxID=119954 RepID=A0ACB9RN82_9MYRT|nr:hypothetical protein MLD38_006549 [Melastoma candidum]